ncbi:MAG: hypothetical protein M1839_006409 [Geoglossum umbratile]|nr:MAG: hypothetical protein M1839_006409 [Geoglossum umbratile]
MGGKKALGENSKKAAGNARKAESAAKKAVEENAKKTQLEEQEWSKGAKSSAKKEAAEVKKAEASRKKAERDALIAEEEKVLKSAKPSKDKSAIKKPAKPLSLADLDPDNDPPSSSDPALNATGIDNALDLLSLTTAPAGSQKVERHPERRFKAALAAYEARRMPEIEAENPGLRLQQRKEVVRKEFEKSKENPFNQVTARFDASKEEVEDVRRREREVVEGRLAEK